jgi:CO/xanthine dehydrogenase FAD-binding subunit
MRRVQRKSALTGRDKGRTICLHTNKFCDGFGPKEGTVSDLFRPRTLSEAVKITGSGAAVTLAAGCTDLFPATQAQRLGGRVMDLTGIAEMRGIAQVADGWRIGAATTWTDIVRADLPQAFDGLRAAAREVGGVQIQNAGTLGGNLCNASPAADGVPPLLTLDAQVQLTSMRGVRVLALPDFITGARRTALVPGEILTAILIPAAGGLGQSAFRKLGARAYLVISIAMVAARAQVKDGRIAEVAVAVGSCGPVAVRLPALEARLVGAAARSAAELVTPGLVAPALSPIDDVRGDAAYRSDAATELVRRALAAALA